MVDDNQHHLILHSQGPGGNNTPQAAPDNQLPKCLAYIVVYNWNKGEPQQRPESKLPTQLQVHDTETQQQTCIMIKDLAESHKPSAPFKIQPVTQTTRPKYSNKKKTK
jgi:hypothetical protein